MYLIENFYPSFKNHMQLSTIYKNGRFGFNPVTQLLVWPRENLDAHFVDFWRIYNLYMKFICTFNRFRDIIKKNKFSVFLRQRTGQYKWTKNESVSVHAEILKKLNWKLLFSKIRIVRNYKRGVQRFISGW